MNDYKILSSFFLGTAIGFAIGALMAPEDGKHLRKKILEEADNFAGNLLEKSGVAKSESTESTSK